MLAGTRLHPVLGPARVDRVLHRGPGWPQGHGRHLQGQSPGARKVWGLAFVVIYVGFGVAMPLAFLHGNNAHANSQVGGITLSSGEKKGRILFGEHCGVCHTLAAANAVGKVGPNLDTLRPPAVLVLHTINNGCLQKPADAQQPAGLPGAGEHACRGRRGDRRSAGLRVRREGRGQRVRRAVRPGRVDRTGAGCRGHGLPEDATAGWRIAPGPEIRLAGQQMLVKPWSSGP